MPCKESRLCVCSVAQLCPTLCEAPLPRNFPGDNTGIGCHFLLQGSSWPTDRTWVSCVSCIGSQILCHCAREAQGQDYLVGFGMDGEWAKCSLIRASLTHQDPAWKIAIFYDFLKVQLAFNFHGSFTLHSSCTTSDQIRPDQLLSRVQLFVTPWIAAWQASLSITNSQSSLKLTSIKSVMPSSHLILCRPLLLLPPIPPSISLFQWVNSSHEVAKGLEFQL